MLKNYFKTAYRNLLRNKFYSFINIFGLATGIACFIFIFLYIQDEVRYDRSHTKADRIYRLIEKIDAEGQGEESTSNPLPVAQTLKADYPQLIEETVRFFNFQQPTLTLGDSGRKFNEKRIFFADSSVFKVFDFPLAQGNPQTALTQPNTVVLTQHLASKYFGSENPMGKTIKFESMLPLTVTGIFTELPEQTHIHFDCLISFATVRNMAGPNFDKSWIWNPAWTYVLLKEGVQPAELEAQFPAFINKYYPDFIKSQITHYLQPLTDIHLNSHLDYEIEPNSDKANIYIFAAIGIFILIIACINFMNLATARAAGRAKEVGVRKATGAHKGQLVRQFLAEALLLSFLAVILSLSLIELLLPIFSEVSGKQMSLNWFQNPALVLGLLVIGLLTGLLSGLYPAFFLSSFDPVRVLKGNSKTGTGNATLRKGLVVMQFAISLALIIATFVVNSQLSFMRSADLGFDKEQVVILPLRPPVVPRLKALENELLGNSQFKSTAYMNEVVGVHHNTHEFNYEGMQADKWIYNPALIVNEDFGKTFGLEVVAGRDFSKDHPSDDSLSVLINEAMVRKLGWGNPEQAIGKRFDTPHGSEKVIGVVKDFNFLSLKQPIGPFVLDLPNKGPNENFWRKYMAIRVAPGNYPATIAHLEETWSKIVPEYPIEYFFLDDHLDHQYKAQANLAKLIGYFSILAIMIACLGLFALASYTAEQRTKEIGIRKVMGASVQSIVFLLTKDFARLVLIAAVIAFPVSWFMMNNWLQNFAFRIQIPVWAFAVAGVAGILIAVLTVSYQAVRAAYSDPVKSIKHE